MITDEQQQKAIPRDRWKWHGRPGHFIGARNCLFRLHTHVGRWCVSTVGEYMPNGTEQPRTIGVDRFFETMVFRCDAKGIEPESWEEIDFAPYNDRDAAEAGHIAMCERWAAKEAA